MPTKPWPLCIITGCPNRTPHGKCEQHRLENSNRRDKFRPNSNRRGYDHTWRAIRADYLAAHPLCECTECSTLPPWQRPQATDVDHVDGQGPQGNNDWENLQALSGPHHSSKTAKQDGGFGRPRKADPR